ncbi:P-loop containing nucleoside triphosphate hydrolase protein [Cadophora sp. DSE1049]|nr:P-loop containing nucleoside triphosphate hydrolase protein [Cadophora sp. DSE1049]
MEGKQKGPDETDAPKSNEVQELPAEVVYKIEYRHRTTDTLIFEQQATESTVGRFSPNPASILEVITVIFTSASPDSNKDNPWTFTNPPPTWSTLPASLKINSPAIIAALQSVVEYYPDQSFLGDSVSIATPYALLIHHQKELEEYRRDLQEICTASSVAICQKQQAAINHLGVLLEFLRDTVGAEVKAERERHARGFATFEMLWLLFKPGEDVYNAERFERGCLEPRVVQEVSGGMVRGKPCAYQITMWGLDYDGNRIGRYEDEDDIDPFDGERAITSLTVFPCKFEDDATVTGKISRRRQLEDRGKLFFRLTAKHCMYYAGLTTTYPKRRHDGLVMVDTETYHINPDNRPSSSHNIHKLDLGRDDEVFEDTSLNDSDCHCPACNMLRHKKTHSQKSRFSSYDVIFPETTDVLTPHQYFLCTKTIPAFVMKTRDWEILDIGGFRDPTFDTSLIEKLVMKQDRRDLIKALSKSYVREDSAGNQATKSAWIADFVQGKGEGQIFLLHGGPGVGKTCTAECVAEYTRRPLLSLTCSDIGVDPNTVESQLIKYFKLAKQWGAILLIDEADIYMEKRVPQDLQRNSLVAGFLRAMEHYQGLLFLTTNRVGAFDDAFVSRIHVALFYPEFTDEDRQKIWKTFIDKLEKDRNGSMRVPIGTKEYLEGNEVKRVKWNGRQIRNAFQTAVALAEFDGEKDIEGNILLKDTHIQKIVKMSSDFTAYLDELHKGSLAKRAEREFLRI